MSSDQSLQRPKPISITELFRNIKAWFNYLLKKWWVIGLVCLVAGIFGYINALLTKPQFESHLTFSLEEGDNSLGGAISLAAEFGFNVGTSSNLFQGDNIVSLLTSRRIVERVLLSADTVNGKVVSMADYFNRISRDTTRKLSAAQLRIRNISFPVGQPRSSFSYLQDSVLLNMYSGIIKDGWLKVGKPDKKLNLYEVSVLSPDEHFTKVFTDKLVAEASQFYTELKSNKSRKTLEILEQRVAQTRESLSSAITGRAAIQDADVNPVFQSAQAQLQKKQVDITAYGGAYGELYKNLELARYQYLKDIPLLQIIDGADYPMKKIKKGKALTAATYIFFTGFLMIFLLSVMYVIKKEKETLS